MAKSRKRIGEMDPVEPDVLAPPGARDTTVAGEYRERIAARAYELYLARGRRDGRALDDWLEAEQELLELTSGRRDRE